MPFHLAHASHPARPMYIRILPSSAAIPGSAPADLALLLERDLGGLPLGINSLEIGFYGDGNPIQPGIHMVHFLMDLDDGRRVRADGFIGDLRDVYGDKLLRESVARLKATLAGNGSRT